MQIFTFLISLKINQVVMKWYQFFYEGKTSVREPVQEGNPIESPSHKNFAHSSYPAHRTL